MRTFLLNFIFLLFLGLGCCSRNYSRYRISEDDEFKIIKFRIKRGTIHGVMYHLHRLENHCILERIFEYIFKKELRDTFRSILDRIYVNSYVYVRTVDVALKLAIRNERTDYFTDSWFSDTFINMCSHQYNHFLNTSSITIIHNILKIKPFITCRGNTVLEVIISSGCAHYFEALPFGVKYLTNTYPYTVSTSNIRACTHHTIIEPLFNRFLLDLSADFIIGTVIMKAFHDLLLKFERQDLVTTLFDRITHLYYTQNPQYYFAICARFQYYDKVEDILAINRLIKYNDMNIIDLAIFLNDFKLFLLAPSDTEYMSIKDSKGKYPTSYIKSTLLMSLCLHRLIFEYCGPDFTGLDPIEHVTDLESDLNTLKLNVLPQFKYILDVAFNSFCSDTRNDNSHLDLDMDLITNIFNIAKYYDSIHDGTLESEIFKKCVECRVYAVVKRMLRSNPDISYNGKSILHFAVELNDPKLFQMVPNTKKYLTLKDSAGKLPISYCNHKDSFDLVIRSLQMEGAVVQDPTCDFDESFIKILFDIDEQIDKASWDISFAFLDTAISLKYYDFGLIFLNFIKLNREHTAVFMNHCFTKKHYKFLLFLNEYSAIFAKSAGTILYWAVRFDDTEMVERLPRSVKFLLVKDLDGIVGIDLITSKDTYSAIKKKILDEFFCDSFEDLFRSLDYMSVSLGYSIVKLAQKFDDQSLFAMLCESIDESADFFSKIFSFALKGKHYMAVKILLSMFPMIEYDNGKTILHYIIEDGADVGLFDVVPVDFDYSAVFIDILATYNYDPTATTAAVTATVTTAVTTAVNTTVNTFATVNTSAHDQWFDSFLKHFLNFRFGKIDIKAHPRVLRYFILQLHLTSDLNLVSSLLSLVKSVGSACFKWIKEEFQVLFEKKLYSHIKKVLEYFPYIRDKKQRSVLHLSIQFEDVFLFNLIPTDKIYLHLLDKEGNTAIYLIRKQEWLDRLIERFVLERTKQKCPCELMTQLGVASERILHPDLQSRFNLYYSKNFKRSGLQISISASDGFLISYRHASANPEVLYHPKLYPHFSSATELSRWLASLMDSFFIGTPGGTAADFTAPLFHLESVGSDVCVPNTEYPPDVFRFAGAIFSIAFAYRFKINYKFIDSFYRNVFMIEPVNPELLPFHSTSEFNRINKLYPKRGIDYDRAVSGSLYVDFKTEIDAMADGFMISRNYFLIKYLDVNEFKAIL